MFLISNGDGDAVAYALFNLEERGPLMVGPQARVYRGMIVGQHTRENDLEVNVLKAKRLTNIRASGKDENINLSPPMKMPLERAMSYIQDDELVEITPEVHPLTQALARSERAKEARACAGSRQPDDRVLLRSSGITICESSSVDRGIALLNTVAQDWQTKMRAPEEPAVWIDESRN